MLFLSPNQQRQSTEGINMNSFLLNSFFAAIPYLGNAEK